MAVKPILVGFGNARTIGFPTTIYVVWPKNTGGTIVNLVIAKSMVAPAAGTMVPMTMMSPAALMARLIIAKLQIKPK